MVVVPKPTLVHGCWAVVCEPCGGGCFQGRAPEAAERKPTGTEHTQLEIAARSVVDALDDGHEEETIFERIGALRLALKQQASAS